MDGSAKQTHHPCDPCGAIKPPFHYPTIGHDAADNAGDVTPMRVDGTASHQSVTRP
jgi:hypothetical protein